MEVFPVPGVTDTVIGPGFKVTDSTTEKGQGAVPQVTFPSRGIPAELNSR